jgi:hypothetical protein
MLLSTTFDPPAVHAITSTAVAQSDHEDILHWTPDTIG